MASGSKQKTTMAKLNRERALRERRELKQAKKDARKQAALLPPAEHDEADEAEPTDEVESPAADSGALGREHAQAG